MAVRRWGVAAAMFGVVLAAQAVMQSTGAAMHGGTANTGSQFGAAELQPPSGLTVTPAAAICVMTLSWTASSSSWGSGYKIYRTANPANAPSLVATLGGIGTTTYQDSDAALKFGLRYYYTVRTYRGSWVSAASNSADALAPPGCV